MKGLKLDITSGILILAGIVITERYCYLLYHSLVELFSILIGFSIFLIAWNTRSIMANNYLLFLGNAYLFISFIDLLHTLAYKGMGVFKGFDADLPTQLWITARYMESISFLIAPLFFNKKVNVKAILFIYFLITTVTLSSIFYVKIFPHCFIEGKGLTWFKILSEYAICLILIASIWHLYKSKMEFERLVFGWTISAILSTIISEIAFTFYISVYGLSNFVGHIFKVISFYCIYKGIVETALKRPYEILWRRLKQNEQKLKEERDRAQTYLDVAGVILVVIGVDERVKLINRKGCELLGLREDQIIGKNWFDHFLPQDKRDKVKETFQRIASGELEPLEYYENSILTSSGERRLIAWHNSILKDAEGNIIATLSSGEDITERRKAELEREKALSELKEAMEKIKVLRGLIPICASCKKIRDDKGYWIQVEAYIREHSDAEFTHSICPDCVKKLYPELASKILKE
jgi:PAS domain S-box-containing protein